MQRIESNFNENFKLEKEQLWELVKKFCATEEKQREIKQLKKYKILKLKYEDLPSFNQEYFPLTFKMYSNFIIYKEAQFPKGSDEYSILAVNRETLGAGNYGKVKFVENENGEKFIIKIQKIDLKSKIKNISDDLPLEYKQLFAAQNCQIMDQNYKIDFLVNNIKIEKNLLGNQAIMFGKRRGKTKINNIKKAIMKYYIVMEYLGIPLNKYLQDNQHAISFEARCELAIKVILKIHELHLLGLAHQDIKPENITINQNGDCSLIDFGLAVSLDDDSMYERGTAIYCPPLVYDEAHQLLNKDNLLQKNKRDILALLRVLFFDPDSYCGGKFFVNSKLQSLQDFSQDQISIFSADCIKQDADLRRILTNNLQKDNNYSITNLPDLLSLAKDIYKIKSKYRSDIMADDNFEENFNEYILSATDISEGSKNTLKKVNDTNSSLLTNIHKTFLEKEQRQSKFFTTPKTKTLDTDNENLTTHKNIHSYHRGK